MKNGNYIVYNNKIGACVFTYKKAIYFIKNIIGDNHVEKWITVILQNDKIKYISNNSYLASRITRELQLRYESYD